MPPKRRYVRQESGTPEEPVFARTSILDNGLIGPKIVSSTQIQKNREFKKATEAAESLYALNVLQLRRNYHMEDVVFNQALDYLEKYLPPGSSEEVIGLPAVGGVDVFGCPDGDFEDNFKEVYDVTNTVFRDDFNANYVLWAIEADDQHFVTAIFHLTKDTTPGLADPRFNRVDAWSIVDPVRSDEARTRTGRVSQRIQDILTHHNIEVLPNAWKYQVAGGTGWPMPWVPPQRDTWSSGLRSYALVREMYWRILDLYAKETGYDELIFTTPTNGWLDVDQVRHEMMGILAAQCMKDMDWKARIGIEIVDKIGTIEGIEEFNTRELRPTGHGQKVWVPESDKTDYSVIVSTGF